MSVRQTALTSGAPGYFTGKPCKRGHVAERRTSDSSCRECLRERCRSDKVRRYARERTKRLRAEDPKRARTLHLKQRYGISELRYVEMKMEQGGRCAMCRTSHPGGRYGRFHVDHDHVTGEVRGLLCGLCNKGLGALRDNPDLLRSALTYLANPPNRRCIL